MAEYYPDRWVLVKIQLNGKTMYKVCGSWFGGYLQEDMARLNSGIARVEQKDNMYLFHGYSGSVYHCHEDDCGTSTFTDSWLYGLIEELKSLGGHMEILPESVDPLSLNLED